MSAINLVMGKKNLLLYLSYKRKTLGADYVPQQVKLLLEMSVFHIRRLVKVLATLLQMQLPVNVLGKAMGNGPST